MSTEQAVTVAHLLTRGIHACHTRDLEELRCVVIRLTGTLDFRYEGAARALAAMYDRGLCEAERGRFELARAICRRMLTALIETVALDSSRA